MKTTESSNLKLGWQVMLRIFVGIYWLFFASQRWFNPFGMRDVFLIAAQGNFIPIYGDLLRILSPNWAMISISVTLLETMIGFMILLGVLLRYSGFLGAFNSLNLTLTFSFCRCSWVEADFPLVFWFYFAPFLLNVQIIFDQSGDVFGVKRLLKWIRKS